jgi:HK97 family phage major capsid protein
MTEFARGTSLEELEDIKAKHAKVLADIDKQYGVQPITDPDERARFVEAHETWKAADEAIRERRAVRSQLTALARDPAKLAAASEGPYLDERRLDEPADMPARLADGLRTIHRAHRDGVLSERAALRLDTLVRRDRTGAEARYLTAVSDPYYERAFSKILAYGQQNASVALSEKERAAVAEVHAAMSERAMGLTSAAGGFAVPTTLDPTVLATSSGVANALRQISRVETITGSNIWKGVASDGVTASFTPEATEASDNSPTLAQPTVNVEKAQAFIPFSIEIGQDWPGLTAELGRMLADAKDALEASKFVTGLGHGSNEPQGLLVGATSVVPTAAATTLAIGDVYSLSDALPPRFQAGASWVASKTVFDKVRRLVGPGNTTEPSIWNDNPKAVLQQPAYEVSTYATALTSGASILTVGDFTRFLIVDRVGMTVELISHLFGTVSNRPTGQRGLYASWRVSSAALTWQAFRTLKVT